MLVWEFCFVLFKDLFWISHTKDQAVTLLAQWDTNIVIHTRPLGFNLFMCIFLAYHSSHQRQPDKCVACILLNSHIPLGNQDCFNLHKWHCAEDRVMFLIFSLALCSLWSTLVCAVGFMATTVWREHLHYLQCLIKKPRCQAYSSGYPVDCRENFFGGIVGT